MKKIICFTLVVVLIFSLCGCGLFNRNNDAEAEVKEVVSALTREYNALLAADEKEAADIVLERIGKIILQRQENPEQIIADLYTEKILTDEAAEMLRYYCIVDALNESPQEVDISVPDFEWGE